MSSYEQHRIRMSEINHGRSSTAVIVSSFLAMLFFLTMTANSCWAQSYDPAAAFEQGFINQTNPDGVWSYGWSTSFTTPITLYDQTAQPGINGPDAQYWISSTINYGESPSAEYNDGPAYDDGNIDFLPDEFLLVSGIAGEYSNLVFTAPSDGMYSITGNWRGCQYGIGVVVGIVVNGNVIFSSTVSQEGQVVPFGTVLNLTAGQTVIFSVGPNGGLQNTGLALTITNQTGSFSVLHNFTGESDGANPTAGLTANMAGNVLYGTALNGGHGYGTVYQLKQRGSGWLFNPLYSFAGGNDGAGPGFNGGALTIGPNGSIYGTTNGGGNSNCDGGGAPYPGCETVFNVHPPATVCITALCPWDNTVLYRFSGGPSDGYNPEGALLFSSGNIYGTTIYGGTYGPGTLFELTPSGSGWTESVLYNFDAAGQYPVSGVIMDNSGNVYGTTYGGGSDGVGTAFQLAPSNGGLTENTLWSFQDGNDGGLPVGAGLLFDSSRNLYGAAPAAGAAGGGTVFELSPLGSWNMLTPLYSFSGASENGNGCGPWGPLAMNAGSLYGTTYCDGAYGYGNVFELTPSGNTWIYSDLHDFTGGDDGGNPISNVSFDTSGKLYGTASAGGTQNVGVVWEITP